MTTCQKCGARVDADDEFCPECGAKTRQQPTEALPAREAQKIILQQAQPKKHRFLTVILIIIVLIFLFKACASFSSEPQISYTPTYTQEVTPASSERLISIETPSPRVNPIPEPEPLINKDAECSGVAAKITDACEESGFSVYDYFTVENQGSTPILGFIARYYTTAMNKDETRLFEPLNVGASYEYYTYYGGVKMIELVPIIVVNGEEIVCDKNIASYGDAYGRGFPSCSSSGDYGVIPIGAEVAPSYGYDATYDVGY
ncbi:MAG: zinc ribbon domain-containing protein [Candidatus Nanoarchaeia archaeon]|nr:zinc ribbon domain-containing protein [Candidatus Nanoarchaeia archaeon]